MFRAAGRGIVISLVVTLLVAIGAAPALGAAGRSEDKGSRHHPVTRFAAPAQASGQQLSAATQGQQVTDGDHGLKANFNGVSSLDSQVTNFGLTFEPPDQGLCEGNGFVVEMVNSAFRIYGSHGATLQGPTNVNAPFHEDFAAFTSDPRCHYDSATNTWFATILFINDAGTQSHLDIAYNTSGDPTTDWSVFQIDTTDQTAAGTPQCPCFGDQPRLGIDSSNIYVNADEFPIDPNATDYYGSEIDVVSKADLVAHRTNPHHVHFGHLTNPDGTPTLAIEPALTTGPAPAEYFLESLDPTGTGDHRIAVWALTNVDRVEDGGRPSLSSLIIGSEAYGIPPGAVQKGSTQTLDSGDDRMQQTQFINGEIWGELTTAVTPQGDSVKRAGAAWFRVRPQIRGRGLIGATVTGQGYVAAQGQYVIYPALQVDGRGDGAMVFTVSSSQRFPSAAYAMFDRDSSTFGGPIVAAKGSGPYVVVNRRWGDYSWAVVDFSTDTIWMATEYMPPRSSQTTNGHNPWGTRVLALELS